MMMFVDWPLIVFLGGLVGICIIGIICLICQIAGVFANDDDKYRCERREEEAAKTGLGGAQRAWRVLP
jgi:hypothetical protein